MTRAAIFDLDGTLFTGHTWEGVMRYLRQQRRNRRWLALLVATHYPFGYLAKMGLADKARMRFAWARHMAWVLRGMSEAEGQKAFTWITDDYSIPLLRNDIVCRVHEHKSRGDLIVLLSGTFEPLLKLIGSRLGIDVVIGTQPEMRNGKYTGRVVGLTCQGEGKAEKLREYLDVSRGDIDLVLSTAYADSITDLPVLELVGHPIAVYPDDELASLAAARGWAIFPERLA